MHRVTSAIAMAIALTISMVAGGCSDDTAAPTTTTTTVPETVAPTIDTAPEPDPVTVSDVTVSPNAWMTVAAVVTATTDRPSTVVVRATAGEHVVETPPTAAGTAHQLDLLGLRPDRDYALEVIATAADGGEGLGEAAFSSGAVPDAFPDIAVNVNDTTRSADGLTYFPITSLGNGFDDAPARPDVEIPERYSAIVAVDESGEVVWYRETGPISGMTASANGTLWAVEAQLRIREIAPNGDTLRTIEGRSSRALRPEDAPPSDAIFVETDTMHHVVIELDDGNLMTLSTELVSVGGWESNPCPDRETPFDGTIEIIGDIVVTFDPDTGEIVEEWSLLDLLDPVAQPGEVICDEAPFPTWYPDQPGAGDWTHANSVEVDDTNDVLLVSVRHLHSVLAIDTSDTDARGSLVWQLGPGLDFALEGAETAEWQYMQHAPEILDDGGLILYDNGNLRPGTTHIDESGIDPYTRAVIYDIDPVTRIATQRWEYLPRDEEGAPIYADFVGDADMLSNGNVLIDHGGIIVIELIDVEGSDIPFPEGHNYARIIEVEPSGDDEGEIVFELIIRDQRSGWMSYAAERFSSLYDWGVGG